MEVVHSAASFKGSVTAPGGAATFTGTVTAQARDPEVQPLLVGQISGALCRALAAPRLAFRWLVTWNGMEIPPSHLVFPLSVTHQRHGFHTWSFGVRIQRDGRSILGRLSEGVEAFCAEVGISLILHTDRGARVFVLLDRGVVGPPEEQRQPPQIRLSGEGRGGRFDGAEASANLPRGSHRRRGQVVRDLLTDAGVPAQEIAIEDGGTITKLISTEREPFDSLVEAVLFPEQRALHWEPATGVVTTAPLGPLPSPPMTVTSAQILSEGPRHSAAPVSKGPTAILTLSTRQLTDPDCGDITTVVKVEIFRIMHRPKAVARYDANGNVTPLGSFLGAPQQNLVSRTEIRETQRCGEWVYRRTGVFEWFPGPEVWKAELNADGTIAAVNTLGYMYEEPGQTPVGGTEIDPVPMRRSAVAHFNETKVTHEYRDFVGGVLVSERTLVEAWRNRRRGLKSNNDPGIPWAEVPYVAGARLLANGHRTGPSGGEEYRAFIGNEPGAESSEQFVDSRDGRIHERRRVENGWGLIPGNAWWYGERETSQFEEERFTVLRRTTESLSGSEREHRKITLTELPTRPDDPDHRKTTVETGRGSLPAVPQIEEPVAGGVAAPAEATQPMEWLYDLMIDSDCRLPRIERLEVPYAETVQELQAVAEHLGREALKRAGSLALRLNPAVTVLRPIRILDPPFLDQVVHPEEVEHSQSAADALPTTRISGSIYDSP